jgi:hypothetical protein
MKPVLVARARRTVAIQRRVLKPTHPHPGVPVFLKHVLPARLLRVEPSLPPRALPGESSG